MDINKLVRDNIKNLKPYSSARDEYTGTEGIFIDANENAIGSVTGTKLNRYPDPLQRKMKEKIAKIKQTTSDRIFLGNGSDEAIDLLFRAFCEPKRDKIILLPPTYGMYEVCANVNDIEIVQIPLTSEFDLDVEAILDAFDEFTKLIFICSPNNPSANCMSKDKIEIILKNYEGLVIVDEAYNDFSDIPGWVPELNRFDNLVVLQTFSKAWGMADIRLGMAFAHTEIIQILNKIKYPYNVNGVTQRIALEALENVKEKNRMVSEILKQKNILIDQLKEIKFVQRIYSSDANFLLVKFDNAEEVFKFLIEKKIIVRNRSKMTHCENCLRITVGTAKENEMLINALKTLEGSL